MTAEPIRLLDDPSVAFELREFLRDQAEPGGLSDGARRMVEARIAASVLALPVSMKLGSLLSPGATTGGGVVSSATSTTVASGVAGASVAPTAAAGGVLATGTVAVTGAAVTGAAVTGAAVTGAAVTGAAVTSAAVVTGVKGVGLLGALSVAKGVAVLGVALATGTGATFAVRSVFQPSDQRPALLDDVAAREENRATAVHRGRPAPESEGISTRQAATEGALAIDEQEARQAGERFGAELSLEDLEDVRDRADHQGRPTSMRPRAPRDLASDLGPMPVNASERLQEEVELLRRAQQLLRVDRVLAAETLERYDAKFPQGAMRAEYDVLRRRLVSQP